MNRAGIDAAGIDLAEERARLKTATMMRDFQAMSTPADAVVRCALAEYHTARYRVREIDRTEPGDDEHSEVREEFESLAREARRAEQKARDRLSNAVASFAGSAPCAVIVESPGGSSVVALSGKPDGMIVATAADRVHIKDVVCRPEPPPEFAHPFRQIAANQGAVYLVMQRGSLLAIYNGVYFHSTNEVVADFQQLLKAGFEGLWSDDFVIWSNGRIMAVIHRSMDREEQKLFLFNEPHNDPIAGQAIDPLPYWPTYDEWVESGRGDLWKTDRYP
jgi:hypothetical protein